MSKHRSTSKSAGDSIWAARPASNKWNASSNWNPEVVPTKRATLGTSSQTGIEFSSSGATIAEIKFAADASAYTFKLATPNPKTPGLTITGAGVSNDSSSTQNFVVASSAQNYEQALLKFANSASAGGANAAYSAGPASASAPGGGVIGFYDNATAGSAAFTVTTGAGTPPKKSTVGGEVSFSDTSNAGTATFTVYGSTSTTDGDTFGNVVFHDSSSAANGVFTNAGGTMKCGDGGNTQFYDRSTAGKGLYHNKGGTVSRANGGDVAFDGTASAADGHYHNYAATANGGHGGVTSFNNNSPDVTPGSKGASAGRGHFFNYGAKEKGQGGGHTFFTAKHGSPTAANGTFVNYGSGVSGNSSQAGHTVFSITLPETEYSPDAGKGIFWNLPGSAPGAPGGYTEFTVYSDDDDYAACSNRKTASSGSSRSVASSSKMSMKGGGKSGSTGKAPTAGSAIIVNVGGLLKGACGGETTFSQTASAGKAQLIALGGINHGKGGRISFHNQASGGSATVRLEGNGTLDISDYDQPSLRIGDLELTHGCIATCVGTDTPCLVVSGKLTIKSGPVVFSFESGSAFKAGTWYTILTAPNLSSFKSGLFTGNAINRASPTFRISGTQLQVSFGS